MHLKLIFELLMCGPDAATTPEGFFLAPPKKLRVQDPMLTGLKFLLLPDDIKGFCTLNFLGGGGRKKPTLYVLLTANSQQF